MGMYEVEGIATIALGAGLLAYAFLKWLGKRVLKRLK